MKEIFARRSIRRYTGEMPGDTEIEKILRAAMAAPTADNMQEWSFIVLKEKESMEKVMHCHPYSGALKTAPAAIIVCARTDSEAYADNEFWLQDCCAASENMLLEATHLGLGSVWLAIYPWQSRIDGIREAFSLPDTVVPVSVIAFGASEVKKDPTDRYIKEIVFSEKYGDPYDKE